MQWPEAADGTLALEIAVDTGGTFNDVVCLLDDGRQFGTKVRSQPARPADAAVAGILQILTENGLGHRRPAVRRIYYGTTVATNCVIERKARPVGLLTTAGFEDVIEIGRQKRPDMYDLALDSTTPTFLVPRRSRIGIPERITADGSVLTTLDEAAVVAACDRLRHQGVLSVAVAYLFSFKNPVHEVRTREIILCHWPEAKVALSCEVNPVLREYERTCVTVLDAYLRPVMEEYLEMLSRRLEAEGVPARVYVSQSGGTLTTVQTAAHEPVTCLKSGPAAGVRGALWAASLSGYRSLITFDMGGTSCDVALVQDGIPVISRDQTFLGFPLRVPMVDVISIGAGGGSIVSVDAAGAVRVGPRSAGADPGPICYRCGGQELTVTDASLVLGYLNPQSLAGGIRVDYAGAHQAMTAAGQVLGLGPAAMAFGIHRIVNANMAQAVRLASTKRGHDPRHFALVLFGGAGAVHGAQVARELSIPHAIVPGAPGLLSAMGLFVSPIRHELTQTVGLASNPEAVPRLQRLLAEMADSVIAKMGRDGIAQAEIVRSYAADMRYEGQSFELEVTFEPSVITGDLAGLIAAFHQRHRAVYGYHRLDVGVHIVNLRVAATTGVRELAAIRPETANPGPPRPIGRRSACFAADGTYVDTPVYRRDALPPGIRIPGPAILEQMDTTTVIYPGQIGRVDAVGNVIIDCVPDIVPSPVE